MRMADIALIGLHDAQTVPETKKFIDSQASFGGDDGWQTANPVRNGWILKTL